MNREISAMLERVNRQLDEAALNEAFRAADALIESLEEAGYEVEVDTLEGLVEAVAELIESDEFLELDEALGQKIKDGFKMVFGKLRKVGGAIKKSYKSGELGHAIKSGELALRAKQGAKAAIRKSAVGKALSKASEKLTKGIEKAAPGLAKKLGAASAKRQSKAYDKEQEKEAKIKSYYKKAYADK